MDKLNSTMAQQIAQAASAFEQQRTGHVPKSVTVVLSEDTLVITLHGALSPAEKALAKSPAGAAQVQEFHRQLFANSSDSLRQEIKRITGVEVREATAEVEPTTGTVVQAFTTGTMVQVFLLAQSVPADTWSGNGSGESVTKNGGSTMLVLSRKKPGIGGGRRVRWLPAHAQSHGARDQRREGETGLRGRCRCSRPSFGDSHSNHRNSARDRGPARGDVSPLWAASQWRCNARQQCIETNDVRAATGPTHQGHSSGGVAHGPSRGQFPRPRRQVYQFDNPPTLQRRRRVDRGQWPAGAFGDRWLGQPLAPKTRSAFDGLDRDASGGFLGSDDCADPRPTARRVDWRRHAFSPPLLPLRTLPSNGVDNQQAHAESFSEDLSEHLTRLALARAAFAP